MVKDSEKKSGRRIKSTLRWKSEEAGYGAKPDWDNATARTQPYVFTLFALFVLFTVVPHSPAICFVSTGQSIQFISIAGTLSSCSLHYELFQSLERLVLYTSRTLSIRIHHGLFVPSHWYTIADVDVLDIGRNRSSSRMGGSPFELQEPPLLFQRLDERISMGTSSGIRY